MDYIISVLISFLPYLVAITITFILWRVFFKRFYWKYYGIMIGLSLLLSMAFPSNTYKFELKRLPNPVISNAEPPKIISDKEIKIKEDEERKKNFDDLVDWKSKSLIN